MNLRYIWKLISLGILIIVLAACATPPPEQLPLPELKVGEWHEFAGPSGTVCADGSAYKYFTYKGKSNTLVIDFQGGGACWDGLTCSSPYSDPNPFLGQGTFSNSIDTRIETKEKLGIYDHSHAENPIKDAYHVLIPYCTGDLHLGNSTQSYINPATQQAFDVQHKGAINAHAVLDWTFDTFSQPESVVILGCSAGAYGATFWTDKIKTNYPETSVYQFGDCGVGAATDNFAQHLASTWNIASFFPTAKVDANFISSTYIQTLANHPQGLKMTQYGSLFDETQIAFYALATGQIAPNKAAKVAAEWSEIMQTSLQNIRETAPSFRSFIVQGSQHCIITSNEFYSKEESGTKLVTWLSNYLKGRSITSIAPSSP